MMPVTYWLCKQVRSDVLTDIWPHTAAVYVSVLLSSGGITAGCSLSW